MEKHLHLTLSNPMWASLTSAHAGFAHTHGALKRFAPDVAPFCAVAHADAELGAIALPEGEIVYFLGTVPRLPANWRVLDESAVLQMVYAGPPPPAGDTPDAPALTDADTAAMLALTELVYPEFFRARTAALGKYIGLHGDGHLAAMAGQRLACDGYREISAVCTHPQHRSLGHAGRLITQLVRAIIAQDEIPFLHVSATNSGAWRLYQGLGFAPSRELRSLKIRVG